MEKKTSGLILAGGCSSRMGRDKAELEYGGKSFLRHQIEKLRRLGIEDIVVAGREEEIPGCRCVPDRFPHRGPLGGLQAGLAAIREERALVTAVDTPLLPEDLLLELLARHRGGITLASCRGRLEPLIGVYDRTVAERCGELLAGEDRSLRHLLRSCGFREVEYTGDPALLMNCNTPDEYETLMQK